MSRARKAVAMTAIYVMVLEAHKTQKMIPMKRHFTGIE
jgi:hypothetical protein